MSKKKYVEYPLLLASTHTTNNVMVFPDKKPRFEDGQTYYMYRDTKNTIQRHEQYRDKKTREIKTEGLEQMLLLQKEAASWILENEDEVISYVGRYEGAQKARYVLLLQEPGEIKMVLLHRWYRFVPKPVYNSAIEHPNTFFQPAEVPSSEESTSEPEYIENFDDDDEEERLLPEESENKEALSEEGKQLKQIIQKFEGDKDEVEEKEELEEETDITRAEILRALGTQTHKMNLFVQPFKDRLQTAEQKRAFKEILREVAAVFEEKAELCIRQKEKADK